MRVALFVWRVFVCLVFFFKFFFCSKIFGANGEGVLFAEATDVEGIRGEDLRRI